MFSDYIEPNFAENLNQQQNTNTQIPENIAARWDTLIQFGLTSQELNTMQTMYQIPQNCKQLAPPQVNPSVKSTVSYSAFQRDEKLAIMQYQLGNALSAIGEVVSSMISDGKGESDDVRKLNDVENLLCHLHFSKTSFRRELICSDLGTHLNSELQDCSSSTWLFSDGNVPKNNENKRNKKKMKKNRKKLRAKQNQNGKQNCRLGGRCAKNYRKRGRKIEINQQQEISKSIF